MTTFTEIPIAKITPHPKNIRRLAEADPEMVASIASAGLITAITVAPAAGGKYLLIAGHRRLDGARKAKLKTIPAMVRDDLATEAEQIEAMAIENVHRQDLTPVEEADAFLQLELIGLKPAEIATKTGRSKTAVLSRLKLAKLGNSTKEAVHDGQITLDQAEQLGKLPDDVRIRVEKEIGSNNFIYKLGDAVRKIERVELFDKRRNDFEARGLPKVDKPEGGWNYREGPCPLGYDEAEDVADAWAEGDEYSGPVLIHSTITATAESEEAQAARAKRDAEWAAEHAARVRETEEIAVARAARVRHIVEQAGAIKIPKHLAPLIGLAIGQQLVDPSELLGANLDEFNTAAGTNIQRAIENSWQYDPTIATTAAALPASVLPAVLLASLAFSAERALYNVLDLGAEGGQDEAQQALAYLAWIESTGYALPDIDIAARDRITAATADDVDEAGAA